jgi:membrane protease YdiL (CAAX protease family)
MYYLNGNASGSILTGVLCASFVAAMLLSMIAAMGLDSDNIVVGFVFTLIRYALLILVFGLYARMYFGTREGTVRELGIRQRMYVRDIFVSCLIALCLIASFMLFSAVVLDFFKLFGYKVPNITIESVGLDTWYGYVLAIITMCLLPAVVEELFFRGLILRGLTEFGKVKAVLISAFMFMIFHLSAMQTIHQFAMGIVLAIVMLKTGNLLYPIIIHFVNNFFVITYTYISQTSSMPLHYTAASIIFSVLLMVVGFVLTVALTKTFKAQSPRRVVGSAKVFTSNNIMLFIALGLVMFFWIFSFVGAST